MTMRLTFPLLLLASTALAAQDPMTYLQVGEGPDHGWSFLLGARLMENSSYLGSDTTRTRLRPEFSAEYDHRWYLGSSRVGPGFGGGVHLLHDQGFTWDLGIGVGDSRPESRSPLLEGMGDRKAEIFGGTGLHYRHEGFRAGLALSHGLRDDAGDRATLTVGQTLPLVPRWYLNLGLHGTWEDAKAMAYDFGVTPGQAQARAALVAAGTATFPAADVGPFAPPAGVRDLGALVSLSYRPAPRWVWTAGVNGGVLQGSARTSPIVGKNGYLGVGVGFGYRFQL
jgi:outer membrane scaffolding protein for murein synthesis (MipA/OmpV family)